MYNNIPHNALGTPNICDSGVAATASQSTNSFIAQKLGLASSRKFELI